MSRIVAYFASGAVLTLFAVSLLVLFKSPDWLFWQLALIAGEFGHWLGLFSIAVAAAAWGFRGQHLLGATFIAVLGLLTALLYFSPSIRAKSLGRSLSEKLAHRFGPVELGRAPFAFNALFAGKPETVLQVRTLKFTADLSLDFYAAADRANAPCVLVVHGGGWDGGARDELPNFNHWLARSGYAVAAISYRLAPEFQWPAQRDDIRSALDFLKSHAAELGIDATRLVLFGRSAGGHLAEATAYGCPDAAIRGVIAFYAPADVHFAWEFSWEDDVLKSPQLLRQFLGGTPENARANYDSASPIRFVHKKTPPTLLLHGQLDTLVWYRQSERLAQKLTEAGAPHMFVSLPWATHAFEYNLNGPGGQLARYSIEWFLAAVTK